MHAWLTRAPRPRATIRLAAVAVLAATPALASCGFDQATSQINQITAGTTAREGTVDALNVLIVSEGPGSGTLIGLLVNGDTEQAVSLETVVSGPDDTAASVERLEINPGGRRQLSEAAARIEGSFVAGQVFDVMLSFDNGEDLELAIPVVTACEEYEGLDDAPSGGETGTTSESETYSCEYDEPVELH